VHCTADFRREVEPGVLVEWQGVHVGAEEDRGTGPTTVDRRDHRGGGAARLGVEPQSLKLVGDQGLRQRQLKADLGSAVDAAPQLDDVRKDRLRGGQRAFDLGVHFSRSMARLCRRTPVG
jgi:hypothetical protein